MEELLNIRNEIDEVDKKITELFEKRMKLVLGVAEYKKKNNLPVLNSKREKEVIEANTSYLKNKEFAEPLEEFFINLMNTSKKLESKKMNVKKNTEIYGLIGEKLGHSFSPEIHELFLKKSGRGGIYNLFELPKDKIKEAIEGFKLIKCRGINVTIPYKTSVMEFLDDISAEAKSIGAVNTLSFKNNKLKGYNTDYIGFGKMLSKFGVTIEGATCVVLGSGGAAKAVTQYLKDNKCKDLYIVTRTPEKVSEGLKEFKIINYDELKQIKNGDVIINCTPCGMYPKVDVSPVDEKVVSEFKAAVDLIYNPLETKFLSYARRNDIKSVNGLYMLVSQAIAAEEIWNDISVSEKIVDEIYGALEVKVGAKDEN